jgi:hypothetical protein
MSFAVVEPDARFAEPDHALQNPGVDLAGFGGPGRPGAAKAALIGIRPDARQPSLTATFERVGSTAWGFGFWPTTLPDLAVLPKRHFSRSDLSRRLPPPR